MFLHLSVVLFTRGRRSLSRGVSIKGSLCPGGLCPGRSLSQMLCPGGLCPGGSLSRGSLSRGSLSSLVSVKGGLCPGGSLGVSIQRGLCQGDPSAPLATVRLRTGGTHPTEMHPASWNYFTAQNKNQPETGIQKKGHIHICFGENFALSKHNNAIMRSNAKCDQQIHLWTDSSPDRELRNQGFHSVVCTLVRCENPSCSLCLPREFVQLERPGREERLPIMSEVKVTITSNARKNAHTKFSFNLHCNFLLPPSIAPPPPWELLLWTTKNFKFKS